MSPLLEKERGKKLRALVPGSYLSWDGFINGSAVA
jgi:hypothetical protein